MKFDFDRHLDNNVLQANRLAPRSYFIPYANVEENKGNLVGVDRSSRCIDLNGEWEFAYFTNAYEAVRSKDKKEGDCISVPELWQFRGVEEPYYVNIAFPYPATPPTVPDCAPAAVYKKQFSYSNKNYKRNLLTFLGVSAGFDLWLNGQYVGYSQGSHYPSEFDVTSFLREGQNELCLVVYKWTTGSWFECQDMLRSNGIFRDVYITNIVENGIYDVSWKTDKALNGYDCKVGVVLQTELSVEVSLTLSNAAQDVVYHTIEKVSGKYNFNFNVSSPDLWNAEKPCLYELCLCVYVNGVERENVKIPVGFRSYTIENSVFLVNGVPIKCRGVNHHDTTPDRGCALVVDDYVKDFTLMKELNINTIRFAHYVPHPAALELCDRMGFYVVDEADLETHGALFMDETLDYFSQDERYRAEFIDRMDRLYERDKNHACIILWSLGNESGFGENHKESAKFLKAKDESLLIHYEGAWNWEGENGFDVVSMMYPTPERMCEMMKDRPNKPLFLCEFAHAMGVGPGGMKEYVDTFYSNPQSMGGCIWEWCDHAYYSKDKSHFRYGGDGGEWIHDGNYCADGLMRADRDFTPAAYEIANSFRPFVTELNGSSLTIHNKTSFTAFREMQTECIVEQDGCKRRVELNKEILPLQSETFDLGDLCGKNVFIHLSYQQNGKERAHEQHVVSREIPVIEMVEGAVNFKETETHYIFSAADVQFYFSKDTSSFDCIIKNGVNYLSDKKSLFYNPYCKVNSFVPNIYRYKIDNDKYLNEEWLKRGYDMMWNRVTACNVERVESGYLITVDSIFSPPKYSFEFKHRFIYTIYANGVLKVEAQLQKMLDKLPLIPRYGVLLNPNEQLFDSVIWNGLGPNENYPDFRQTATIGEYVKSIHDMYYEYVAPQENGERDEVTHLQLVSSQSDACLHIFASEQAFSFRISDFSGYDLLEVKHIGELVRGEKLELSLDGFVSGLGSNSCGPEPFEGYRIDSDVLQFSFILKME